MQHYLNKKTSIIENIHASLPKLLYFLPFFELNPTLAQFSEVISNKIGYNFIPNQIPRRDMHIRYGHTVVNESTKKADDKKYIQKYPKMTCINRGMHSTNTIKKSVPKDH